MLGRLRDPASPPGQQDGELGPRLAVVCPQSDARTQILWGMRYVNGHYRTPYRAWLQESVYGWY